MLCAVRLYRPARPARKVWYVTKTIVFLLIFWLLFLFVFPMGVAIQEVELAMQRFPSQPLAEPLLLLCTLLSVWSAMTLAIAGEGTPFPFDTARKLVVTGPYAFVRNPLMVATTGQGVALGMALGSGPIIAYISFVTIVWYFLMRPAEERDLAARFGDAWRRYTKAVRSGRPRLTPYRATDRG